MTTSIIKTALNNISVINLAKVTEQELHLMVNDINRNFNILANSSISKGPAGLSPELKLVDLAEGTNVITKYPLNNGYINVDTDKDVEISQWQGYINEQQYQAMPLFVELFKNGSKEIYNGIVTKDINGNFIGDLSGWLYQSGINVNTNMPIYSVVDAFPKLYKKSTAAGDIKYTWMINGIDTNINAEGKQGDSGTNANIYASDVSPLSQSFIYQNVEIGDILFAPDSDPTSELFIWKYETNKQTGITNWIKEISLTKYFPTNSNGESFINQIIQPRQINTELINIASNINNKINEPKTGLSFSYPKVGNNNGSNILCAYRFGILEEKAYEDNSITAQYLNLKLDRTYTDNNEKVINDFNFIPGLKFDNSVNIFNLHMGDSKIDFAPYTSTQIKYLENNSNIFGSSNIKHVSFELLMETDSNNNRYLNIKDYNEDGTFRNRSFMQWKILN